MEKPFKRRYILMLQLVIGKRGVFHSICIDSSDSLLVAVKYMPFLCETRSLMGFYRLILKTVRHVSQASSKNRITHPHMTRTLCYNQSRLHHKKY